MDLSAQRSIRVIFGGTDIVSFLNIEAHPAFKDWVEFEIRPNDGAMNRAELEACGSAQITTLLAIDWIYKSDHAADFTSAYTAGLTADLDAICPDLQMLAEPDQRGVGRKSAAWLCRI
jgi:hypothetical protein